MAEVAAAMLVLGSLQGPDRAHTRFAPLSLHSRPSGDSFRFSERVIPATGQPTMFRRIRIMIPGLSHATLCLRVALLRGERVGRSANARPCRTWRGCGPNPVWGGA